MCSVQQSVQMPLIEYNFVFLLSNLLHCCGLKTSAEATLSLLEGSFLHSQTTSCCPLHTHTHTPLSLVLTHCCVTHSFCVSCPRPAPTDAGSQPLTFDLRRVPIFGVKNELLKLRLHRCFPALNVQLCQDERSAPACRLMMKWRQVRCNGELLIRPSQDLWSALSSRTGTLQCSFYNQYAVSVKHQTKVRVLVYKCVLK